MDEDSKISIIKRIKLEQVRLRQRQQPSVKDTKLEKRKKKLARQYWDVVKKA
ncbi:MAG TPA: hypothetical protein VKK79_04845 [Candidatus Lokiarchaeia archaeon]|nr:hypothetical protein [Candidatus Lokiarchaeia archaeon]